MVKRIDVPGLGLVEFPDGMSDAEIVSAIEANSPRPSSPADGVGMLGAGLIAAGRTTDKVVQGVRQMYNTATNDQATLDRMAQDEAGKDAAYAPLKKKFPIATSLGEAAPMLAVPALGGAGAAGVIGSAAVAGALPPALSYGSLEDRAKGAALGGIGGAIGGSIGLGLSKLLKPAGAAAGGVSDDAAAAAHRVGFNLSPGQRTQNQAMQGFENYLAKSPGSSGTMQAKAAANQAALNKAAAGAIGQRADALDEGVFSAAKNAIGQEFARLQGVTNPVLGNDFMSALIKVDSDNMARGAFRSKGVDKVVSKALDLAAQGKLSGKAYKEIRTELTTQAEKAFEAKDATLGQAIKTIRASLDDAAKKSLSADDQKAWDIARDQWRAYKTLTKSNVVEAGNVSAARVASQLRRGGDGFKTGAFNGGLTDIGRLGEAVKGVQNPNSGQLVQQMLYGNPLTGVPMMLGNKAIGGAYNSALGQRYFSKGLLDLSPNGEAALWKLAGPTGSPLAQNWLGAQ